MKRAIVIGGSMGGLFAAHNLLRAGWDVQVFERVGTEIAGRGAGIATHKVLWDAVAALGIDPGPDRGVEVQERLTLDRAGQVIGTFRCPQVMTSWDRLFHLLHAAFPAARYHHGKDLQRVAQTDADVTAHFADGTSATADLLVGADGIRSTVRGQFLPAAQPRYAGYTAWRGLVAEAAFPPALHAQMFLPFAFCLPQGEQMLGYPVAGPNDDLRPGHRRYNFVWYRPADEAAGLPRLLTDGTGRTHTLSIPPPLIRPEIVAEMREAARLVLAPQFAAIVDLCPLPFLQPVYDLESERLAFGRAVLLGDAAFVARPHVGAGVTKAAEDAAALAAALSATPDLGTALRRYDAERRAAGRRILQRARHLGAYIQASRATAEEHEAATRHATPEAVMAETALLDF